MLISDISIRRPVFTTMVTIALMTIGLLAARSIGVDLFPDISFPIVSVVTVYPGAGPEEVEQLVTKPIEEAVSGVNGVEEVRSYSRDSVSTIIIQFKLEADIKSAAMDVRDKLAAIRNHLPSQIKEPTVQRIDPTALPILIYAVSSKQDSAQTRQIVEDVIKPRIEAVDGVAAVSVVGGLEREVHVFVDRTKVEGLRLSMVQIAQQLASEGNDIPGGHLVLGEQELSVKLTGRYKSKEELANVVLMALPDGSQVRLKDVARIDDGHKEVRTKTSLNGLEGVSFTVQKQGGSNTVAISDKVYKVMQELQPKLPPDMQVVKAIDVSVFIRQNIYAVTEAILFGGLMAIMVIFLFMMDWRSTLISSLALPTSVVTTFFVMWYMGFTFNMMSLLGLSLAIGLLIDDAVVVRENIYRHMEKGEDPITAARRGTAEIGLAVMATTFAIVAVFVPIAFMGGLVGNMFRQFGLTVAAAVLVSLFVSFTLDPMMSARVVKAIQPGHKERLYHSRFFGPLVRFFDGLDASYHSILKWSLGHKKTVVLSAVALFFGSCMLTPYMGKEFFAVQDRGEFAVNVELPAGTSLRQTEKVAKEIEAIIKKHPEVRSLFTTLGPSEEVNKATIRTYTTKKEERKIGQEVIQEELRLLLAQIPGIKFAINDIQFIEGPAQELPITLYVRGNDYDKLQHAAAQALDVVKNVAGAKDADMSLRLGKPELSIVPDRARAGDLGVDLGTVAQTIRLAIEGEVVGKYRAGDRDFDIRVQLEPSEREVLSTVPLLTVPVTKKAVTPQMRLAGLGQVRVQDVSDLKQIVGPSTIERMNRQRQIIITANIKDRSLGDVVGDIQKGLNKLDKSSDVSFIFGGQTQRMQETFNNMGIALLVAILFIYFVLASQFESFIHPFTIMAALPLAIVGALFFLFLTGFNIGMPAMIGIVLLMGLVTKNSILLVDYTNELRAKGKPMVDALLEAGPVRLRPILMTSAAMVLGMLPTALSRAQGSEFRAPMSIAVIGGVITSTFLTLVVVPVVYTWMDRFTLKGRDKSPATVKTSHEEFAANTDKH